MAKEINLVKQLNGSFIPETDQDKETTNRFKVGDTMKAKVSKPRNPQFHRKFFALLNITFQNQSKHSNFDHFRKYVICCTGRYDEIPSKKGIMIFPHSIAFGSMDEVTFSDLYNDALDVCSLVIKVDKEDLDKEAIQQAERKIQDFY